jgi:hypothetical protein
MEFVEMGEAREGDHSELVDDGNDEHAMDSYYLEWFLQRMSLHNDLIDFHRSF